MYVNDYWGRDITYETSHEGIERTVTMDSSTKGGTIYLNSGEQFSSTDNSTWQLYIYADEELMYTINMVFETKNEEILINVEEKGLDNNSGWKIAIFGVLILTSSMIGWMFNKSGDEGVETFFVGSFVSAMAVTSFGWLALMGAVNYTGRIIKKRIVTGKHPSYH